jgi:MFS family permease
VVSISVAALHSSYGFALVTLVFAGLGSVLSAICINALLQTEAPDLLRGRVIGFYSFVVLGFAPFGALQAGWIAEHYGVNYSFLVGGLICGAAIFAFEKHRTREKRKRPRGPAAVRNDAKQMADG